MVGRHPRQRTALIVTVLNEAKSLDELLRSIQTQTVAPDEVVIVDGGSTDGTWQALQRWTERLPLRALWAPGVGIARGRNLAIRASTADVLAITDAGVRLDEQWLEWLLSRLGADVDVVSGFFRADPRTVFETAMGATVLPGQEDVRPSTFLPSSRSILFRRAAWERAGGYPEWLDYCEDLVFDLALRQVGCRFAFAPRALVWFRPRGSWRAFFRQYYLYARGDGKADLWRRRHTVRYLSYVVGCGLLTCFLSPERRAATRFLSGVALLLGGAIYTRRPYARLWPLLSSTRPRQRAYALALVPLVRLVGDVAKMLGYPVGVQWRLRTRWMSRSSS